MKYSNEILVNVPRDRFVELLDNPDNMKHWQRGLVDARRLDGMPGEEGAQMVLEYKMGKREIEMVETIVKRDFPEQFHARYETKGVVNIQHNYFEDLYGKQTKWISESEFKFSSFGMKLMGWLMPGAFKKQSQKFLEDFKQFAETGRSVATVEQ